MLRLLALLLLSGLSVAAGAGTAAACSGCPRAAKYAQVQNGFPTNGIIRLRYPDTTQFFPPARDLAEVSGNVELREANGALVPASFRRLASPTHDETWFELLSDRPLRPATVHVLIDHELGCGADAGACDGGQNEWVRFTTGEGPERTPPTPELVNAECAFSCAARSSCDGTKIGFYVWLDLAWPEPSSATSKVARTEATATGVGFGPTTFELSYKQGHIALAGPLHLFGLECGGVGPPPTIAAPDGQLVVQVHAVDLAGNRTTAAQAVLIEHSSCQCSARIVPAGTEPREVELRACPQDAGCIDLTDAGLPAPQPSGLNPPDEGFPSCGCSGGSGAVTRGGLVLLLPALLRARRRR